MSLSIAIVGLPNVGKSTLFNALLKRQAALAANYPFATIEPNVGIVPVPDDRLSVLADIVGTTVIKPATVEFVDIAGLVKGASQGEGLGNKFLANIRETDAIVQVVRAFANEDIIREGSVDPASDLEVVRTELQLADLATLAKQAEPKGKVEPSMVLRWQIIQALKAWVEQGRGVNSLWPTTKFELAEVQKVAKELGLLTAKPELIVVNVDEATIQRGVEELSKSFAGQLGVGERDVVVMCNQIESELSSLSDADQKLYLQDLGLSKSGLERLITAAYQLLGLDSFLTAGEKEVRAWTIKQGTAAPQAAAVIHTDFEKKFIMAKVASFADFVEHSGWKGLKVVGKIRQEGREYIMQPNDIVEFAIGG
jgi:ribosome-binding ATPase